MKNETDYNAVIVAREFTTLENSSKVVASRLRTMIATPTKEGRAALKSLLKELYAVTDVAEDLLLDQPTSTKSLQLALEVERQRTISIGLGVYGSTKTANARR